MSFKFTTDGAVSSHELKKMSCILPSFLRLVEVSPTFIAVHLNDDLFRNICWARHGTGAGYLVGSKHRGFVSVHFSLSTRNHTLKVDLGYCKVWSYCVIFPL